jgi:hypothetical protein
MYWLLSPVRSLRSLPLLPLLPCVAVLCACTVFTPLPGQTVTELRAGLGEPTAVYTLADGTRRLEYATGPYGRTTWMADLDASGRVRSARQVLTEAHFLELQARAPDMGREELLHTLGRPGEVHKLARGRGEYWAWRYPTFDCLWFTVTVSAEGRVRDSGFGVDPVCDTPADAG